MEEGEGDKEEDDTMAVVPQEVDDREKIERVCNYLFQPYHIFYRY